MRLIIGHQNFKRALTLLSKVVSHSTSLPILNNVFLKTEGGRLKMSSTNLEIGLTCFMGAKIEEAGEVAVPARILTDFISSISDDKITLQVKNNILTIESPQYKTQILASNPKDFPIIPKIKNEPLAVIPAKVLRNILSSVVDATAISEVRPELSGVYFQLSPQKSCTAATDSFRLSEKIFSVSVKNESSIILPRPTVIELIRISGEVEGDIQVRLGDNQVSFTADDIEIVSRLIDARYPDYSKIIPEKIISKVLVKKTELEKNVRLAGLFTSHIADIRFFAEPGKIILVSKSSEKGEIKVEIEATLKNDPFEISLNYGYLIDGIKIIQSEDVVVEFSGQGSPLVVRSSDSDYGLTYLIMPLRSQ